MKSNFERVSEWNERCGNIPCEKGTKEYWERLDNQLKRIEEEVAEIREAIEEKDFSKLMDGIVDTGVTVEGIAFLSDLKIQEAFNRILDNNDLKYTTNESVAQMWLEELQESDKKNTFYIVTVTVDDETYYTVHRGSDDKICKQLKHPTVDLSDLVPNTKGV